MVGCRHSIPFATAAPVRSRRPLRPLLAVFLLLALGAHVSDVRAGASSEPAPPFRRGETVRVHAGGETVSGAFERLAGDTIYLVGTPPRILDAHGSVEARRTRRLRYGVLGFLTLGVAAAPVSVDRPEAPSDTPLWPFFAAGAAAGVLVGSCTHHWVTLWPPNQRSEWHPHGLEAPRAQAHPAGDGS